MKQYWICLVMVITVAGCGKTYDVEMSVEGGRMNRSTTIGERFASASQPTSLPTTQGAVDGIGESSHLLHYETSMGQAWLYLEHIRGNDSPADILQQRFKAADDLADLLLDWSAKRYARQKEYAKLKVFIDKDLRKDLKNLATWSLLSDAIAGTSGQSQDTARQFDVFARVIHYLVEHKYLTQDDVPAALMLFNFTSPLDDEARIELARRVIVNKVGLTDKAFIDDLLSPSPADDPLSFDRAMQSNPGFRQSTQPAPATQDSDAKPIQPRDYAFLLTMQIVGPNLMWLAPVNSSLLLADMFMNDQVRMSLAITGDVVASNGVLDEKAAKLQWAHSVHKDALRSLGSVHYAAWAKPDEAFQTRHFGKVLLQGSNLAGYCLWRKSLKTDQGSKWDDFVASLRPGNAIVKLSDYQAALDRAAKSAGREPAPHYGVKMLLDALETPPASGPGKSVDTSEDK